MQFKRSFMLQFVSHPNNTKKIHEKNNGQNHPRGGQRKAKRRTAPRAQKEQSHVTQKEETISLMAPLMSSACKL
jgi:hypothetical protein